MELDLEYYRTWIGREESASELVTPELVQRFNATLDIASGDPQPGDAVAPLIHLCLAPSASPTAELGPDGSAARGEYFPPVPLPRRMWAGGELVFERDICVGDQVKRTSRIEDVVLKEGRTGTLCFLTVNHTMSVTGDIVVREKQVLVYRGMEDASRLAAEPSAAEPGKHQRRIAVSTPLLFRYSALTFNGHRIHYDRPYTTGEEGYPGLIVHGPLQATLLVQFAAKLRDGRTPRRFDYKSHTPLFDDRDFSLHATDDGDRLKLWTACEGGPVAMAAEASW
ncbi:MaoC family dehydratase N-terminal domain-containing protein [Hoeflea sp. TYP-13]|uniref:FAS1-like dehydratase domain-containing protein n=1 Tax=Hoeflea sp. TYP-13 TaxID=3230023 RepID=UPI0034C6A27F